jgi:hypothetical protein
VLNAAGNKWETKEVAKRERVRLKRQILDLFGSVFFQESPKTDNMNREDLKHQKIQHTFSESTGVFRRAQGNFPSNQTGSPSFFLFPFFTFLLHVSFF